MELAIIVAPFFLACLIRTKTNIYKFLFFHPDFVWGDYRPMGRLVRPVIDK